MDAKNIFIACRYYKYRIKWENKNVNEWSYIGVGDDFREEVANETIRVFFSDPEIYLVVSKQQSFEIASNLAVPLIKELLVKTEVTLSNKEFSKMIVFNKIGVLKKGTR